ncbi:NAD(P)/FAD-dependent oxidoreductase [Chloroflexota bacterium]
MVIVLGNGVAGNTAGSTIRRLDSQADITIVSEETYPEYTACALPYYLAGELRRRELFLKTKKDYSREGIKTIFGQSVTSISPESKKIFLNSKSISYDKLIIAIGSKPIVPPIQGINLDGVFTLKSPGDADKILDGIGSTAVIIGSGPIGLETSIALRKRGAQVYLIEVLDRIMPRIFDETPSSLLKGILEERGVRVLTGEKVISIVGSGRVEAIITDKQRIKCDEVVLGTGMRPDVELARQAGITIGTLGGISVTRQMMTNLDDIYACGDCVETRDMAYGKETLSPLWHNAKRQGIIAGYNCCGIPKVYPGSENITSLDVYGTHAASFGSIETGNQDEDIEVIEKYAGNNYYRLIISKGHLIGAQSIGDAQDMGALLYSLLKRENLNKIKSVIEERTLPLNSRHHRVARYIAP